MSGVFCIAICSLSIVEEHAHQSNTDKSSMSVQSLIGVGVFDGYFI